MKKFKVEFTGKPSTSIGIRYKITEIIKNETDNKEEIRTKLYEKYEFISIQKITEVKS